MAGTPLSSKKNNRSSLGQRTNGQFKVSVTPEMKKGKSKMEFNAPQYHDFAQGSPAVEDHSWFRT